MRSNSRRSVESGRRQISRSASGSRRSSQAGPGRQVGSRTTLLTGVLLAQAARIAAVDVDIGAVADDLDALAAAGVADAARVALVVTCCDLGLADPVHRERDDSAGEGALVRALLADDLV